MHLNPKQLNSQAETRIQLMVKWAIQIYGSSYLVLLLPLVGTGGWLVGWDLLPRAKTQTHRLKLITTKN